MELNDDFEIETIDLENVLEDGIILDLKNIEIIHDLPEVKDITDIEAKKRSKKDPSKKDL